MICLAPTWFGTHEDVREILITASSVTTAGVTLGCVRSTVKVIAERAGALEEYRALAMRGAKLRARPSTRLVDWTGKKFNEITVVKRAPNQDGAAMWEVLHECGHISIRAGYNLGKAERNGYNIVCPFLTCVMVKP